MASLGRALSDLAAQSASLVATRIELLGLEAQDAQARLLQNLAVLLLAVFALLAALTVATVAVVSCVWDTGQRNLALGLMALFYAAAAGGLFVWLWLRLRRAAPFAVTRQVLLDDARMLQGRNDPPDYAASDGTGHAASGQQGTAP